jgi:hypothetical protein
VLVADEGQRGGGIPLGQWSGSDATDRLRQTVEKFAEDSKKQTRTMIGLTVAIAALTVIMVVEIAVQISRGL